MKKIIICLTALIALVACGNKTEQNDDKMAVNDETVQSEIVASEEDQGGWAKQTTILSSKPMVVDFFATWCGPCKELTPILEEIEQNHKGEVIFKRVDVDKVADLAREFNVEAIPMLMFITPTGEYQTLVGLQSPEIIEEKISQLLKRSAK